jgi:acyl-CoA dehydrogenase
VGQRELKRAPTLAKKTAEAKKKEAELFERHGLKLPQ